jgi:hypothetical protein
MSHQVFEYIATNARCYEFEFIGGIKQSHMQQNLRLGFDDVESRDGYDSFMDMFTKIRH